MKFSGEIYASLAGRRVCPTADDADRGTDAFDYPWSTVVRRPNVAHCDARQARNVEERNKDGVTPMVATT